MLSTKPGSGQMLRRTGVLKLGPAFSQRRLVKEESVVRAEQGAGRLGRGWRQEGKHNAESVGPGGDNDSDKRSHQRTCPNINHRKQIGV